MYEIPSRLADIFSGSQPPAYRIFLIARDGTMLGTVRLSVTDDEEGLRRAKLMVDGHAVELWDGLRFIEHFPAYD